jgi:hypothetical protein
MSMGSAARRMVLLCRSMWQPLCAPNMCFIILRSCKRLTAATAICRSFLIRILRTVLLEAGHEPCHHRLPACMITWPALMPQPLLLEHLPEMSQSFITSTSRWPLHECKQDAVTKNNADRINHTTSEGACTGGDELSSVVGGAVMPRPVAIWTSCAGVSPGCGAALKALHFQLSTRPALVHKHMGVCSWLGYFGCACTALPRTQIQPVAAWRRMAAAQQRPPS